MSETPAVPNPGSDAAIARGCVCARWDNHHGAGMPSADGPLFYVRVDCPLHGTLSTQAPEACQP